MKWIQRLSAENTIIYRKGVATASNGKMMQWKLSAIAEALTSEEITVAEIWIKKQGAIHFSKEIPSTLHQRLRNMIAG